MRRLTGSGPPHPIVAGLADTAEDYYHPVFWSRPTDPEYTVACTEAWGVCEIEGARVRVPVQATPTAGTDGHMAVIDGDGWEYDFWQVGSRDPRGGVLRVSWGGRARLAGSGLGSAATAAHFGLAAGSIRAAELAAGRIDHALFMVVPCTNGRSVYPAQPGASGATCADTRHAPPLGGRFVLTMTRAEIAALGVPRWKEVILVAMAQYGMYVGDTGGSRGWAVYPESGATYTALGQQDPLSAYASSVGLEADDQGRYEFDLAADVPWERRLVMVEPCTARDDCDR